jgi:hypothetical protein
MYLLPHCFCDQTDQSVRNGIREKNPKNANAEVETKTGEHDWLTP